MTNRMDKIGPVKPGDPAQSAKAFDLWLNRGLHRLYGDVAKEPVPDDLLKLIGGHKAAETDAAAPEPDSESGPGAPDPEDQRPSKP